MSDARARGNRGDLKSTTYELFILAVSLLSIVNLALYAVLPWQSQAWWLVAYVDAALTIIFVSDFASRMWAAPSKRGYFLRGGGVFDLLACVPALRIFRVFRIVRAGRIVRSLGGRRLLGELRGSLASGTLYLVVFLGLVTLEVVGLLELHFEEDAVGANIVTAGDALWWGYVTATTVGYGDQYPVTPGGRIVGFFMLTVGVALFATFSGFLANLFLSQKRRPAAAVEGEGDALAALRALERLNDEQRSAIESLRARLEAVESPG